MYAVLSLNKHPCAVVVKSRGGGRSRPHGYHARPGRTWRELEIASCSTGDPARAPSGGYACRGSLKSGPGAALASRRLPPALAEPIPTAKDVAAAARDDRPAPRHVGEGTTVGRRAHPRRVAQAQDQ